MRTTLFLALLALLGCVPANAITNSFRNSGENSGFVRLVGTNKTCSGVLLTNDLILTAKSCFNDEEFSHPELLGYFMGSQDSDANPIRDIVKSPDLDIAMLRLSVPLIMNGTRFGFRRRIFPLEAITLRGARVRCSGYGAFDDTEYSYGENLTFADFSVDFVRGQSPNLGGRSQFRTNDLGGACLLDFEGQSMVAVVITNVQGSEQTSATMLRGWLGKARLFHELVAANTGNCMDVEFASQTGGARVKQFPCHSGANQRWELKPITRDGRGGILYELHARHSNKCLGISGGSLSDDGPAIQWTCTGEITDPVHLPSQAVPDQLWLIQYTGEGLHQLVNYQSGKCLDAGDSFLRQRTCASRSAPQTWRINAAFESDGETHRLVNRSSGDPCAEVLSRSRGARVDERACHGRTNQQWKIESTGGVFHIITNRDSAFLMDVEGGMTDEGRAIIQWSATGGANQRWRFEWRSDGYAVRSEHSNKCLSVPLGYGSLQQLTCGDFVGPSSVPSQTWYVD